MHGGFSRARSFSRFMVNSWEYVAGFWDGEGCIWFPVGCGRTASASISQTKPEVLYAIKEFMDKEGVFGKLRVQTGKSKRSFKDNLHYTLLFQGSQRVSKLLQHLLPHLNTVKKSAAQDILRFFKIYPPLKRGPKPS